MDEQMDTEEIQSTLMTVSMLLAMIPTPSLEAHAKRVADELSRYDSIGVLLNPTLLQTGADKVARSEKKMVDAYLEVRKAIDEREANVAVVQRRSQTLKDTGWFG